MRRFIGHIKARLVCGLPPGGSRGPPGRVPAGSLRPLQTPILPKFHRLRVAVIRHHEDIKAEYDEGVRACKLRWGSATRRCQLRARDAALIPLSGCESQQAQAEHRGGSWLSR